AVGPCLAGVAVCVGTHLAALLLGLGGSRALGFDRPDGIAVAFAGSQKTLPVSLFLFEAYYQGTYPLAVLSLLFSHVGQLVVDRFVAERLAGAGPGAAGDDRASRRPSESAETSVLP